MVRKVFRTGNSLVVALPRDTLDALGVGEGTEVWVEVDRNHRQIVITPASTLPKGLDEGLARQVAEFIEQYRPALETLAKA